MSINNFEATRANKYKKEKEDEDCMLENVPIKSITLVGKKEALIYPLYQSAPYKINLPKKELDKVKAEQILWR